LPELFGWWGGSAAIFRRNQTDPGFLLKWECLVLVGAG
jgi:hypothetical protein